MKDVPLEQQLAEYKQRLEAANGAIEKLQPEVNRLRMQVSLHEAQKAQWEGERLKQNTIIHQALSTSNTTSNDQLEEIERLRNKVRELGG